LSLKLFLFFVSLPALLFSLTLKENYTINGLDFKASSIDASISNDFIIYHFEKNKHVKSFTSQKLLKRLKDKGLELEDKTKGIVHIYRSSQLDYAPITQAIKDYYHDFYPNMHIKNILYSKKNFIQELSTDYTLQFKKKAYLYHRSNLQLLYTKTDKRHFISYTIEATLKVFKARNNINRGKLLTPLDLRSENEVFKRFKSLPIQTALKGRLRLKKRLIKGKIVYLRDIEKLPDVLKNKEVNVRFISGNVHLEFLAISLEDGHIGEEINIKKRDGKRLKAKVISPNFVEIQ